MRPPPLLSCLLLLPLLAATARASAAEGRLLSDLLTSYDRRVRPVVNQSEPVTVKLGLTLQEVDLHLDSHEVTLSLWVNIEWTDPALRWNPEDYDDIQSVRLMPSEVWTPDIMLYNMRPRPDLGWLGPTPVVVSSDGTMLYVAPSSPLVKCRRDYMYGPEIFICTLKLGSWTYDSWKVDLTISADEVDLSSYVNRNSMWELLTASVQRNVIMYACCPEPYVDVTMRVEMRRPSSLSAWPNLPVAVSVLTSLATFLVPVDSPQKLTLPCLSVLAAGSGVLSEFGLQGTAEYRAHFLRVYHVYTYIAGAVLLWTVLVVLVGRPRALRLPSCLRRCLTGCLGAVCCLASPPESDDKQLCYEWVALAEMLDRVVFVVFLILIIVGSTVSTWASYQ